MDQATLGILALGVIGLGMFAATLIWLKIEDARDRRRTLPPAE